MRIHTSIIFTVTISLSATLLPSCKKFVTIPPPKHTISTLQMFETEEQADGALAGIYSMMINGDHTLRVHAAANSSWGAGLLSILGGLSGGDVNAPGNGSAYFSFGANKIILQNAVPSRDFWNTAYKSIYGANSIIEGIAASTSGRLRETARKELTGEAKFVRALAYFYLTNYFGDVPLALTVDFNQTSSMTRTSQQEVYRQIIDDLKAAVGSLREDYSTGINERVRPNKWAAATLLARVYLYQGEYADAAALATEVINRNELYALETDLNKSFTANSREAIWQLKQTSLNNTLRNATPEGYAISTIPAYKGVSPFPLTDHLMGSFEPGDKRREAWTDSTNNSANGGNGSITHYATKYKIGSENGGTTTPKEYYMVLRFAELYLIRAEAAANGALGGIPDAVADLNVIRGRAGLAGVPNTLTKEETLDAVANERQRELFCEWGHRWLDLKRTARATAVLQSIPHKLPWEGDYQLLYPIPTEEIRDNIRIIQNPGYF